MSTTTQILFNSPALHSLKRDQLVKLCKIHALKASGKNVELIGRLKEHALTLPKDSPLSVAARSEGPTIGTEKQDESTEDDNSGTDQLGSYQMLRPRAQWEVVMESIQEATDENSSQGTLSSLRTLNNLDSGEFGMGGSKSSTMSSSIKTLASSFGLKRRNISESTLVASSSIPSVLSTSDELSQHSTPYSSLPQAGVLPQTDHFTFDPPMQSKEFPAREQQAPLPGHSLRPGVPVPSNARLSLGLDPGAPSIISNEPQPTTTIRLISNSLNPPSNNSSDTYIGRTPQLKPLKTSFDLIMGSPTSPTSGPGYRGINLWPPEDPEDGVERLYPSLPLDLPLEVPSAIPDQDRMDMAADAPMPGSLPSQPPQTPAASTGLVAPSGPVEPFIFGSPLPQHNVSNAQFKTAATSVLDEMNKRLQAEGVQVVGMDLIHERQPVDGIKPLVDQEVKSVPKGNGIAKKFEKMHEQVFKKMEGIDGFSKRRSADETKKLAIAKKRRSSVVGHGAGRDRFGRRVGAGTPGRLSGRVVADGKKPRVLPGSFGDDDDGDDDGSEEEKTEEEKTEKMTGVGPVSDEAKIDKEQDEAEKEREEEGKRKEKEAIKRKLELNKARRKSSVGVAGGRGRVSVGRGGVLLKPQPQPKPARFGFLSSAKSLVRSVFGRGKTTASVSTAPSIIPKVAPSKVKKSGPPSLVPAAKKASASVASQPSVTVSSSRGSGAPSLSITSSSRPPIPLFGTPSTSTRTSLLSAASTRTSRSNSTIGTSTSKGSSVGGVSSIGTRSSAVSSNKLSGTTTGISVSSLGSKKALDADARSSATGSSGSTKPLSRTSSRLLAPTASSLAKATVSSSSSGSKVAATSRMKMDASLGALSMITNSPGVGKGPLSPRPGGIFSKPLEMPSGIPVAVKKRVVESTTPSIAGSSGLSVPVVTDTGELKDGNSSASTTTKQRPLVGRKPHISRSKVIAKLASQRAATASGSIGARVSGTPSQGRVRSSLGAKAQRSSYGGKTAGSGRLRGSGGSDVTMSAKKRVRQSEYARRRSRIEPLNLSVARGEARSADGMDVDPK